MSDPIQTGDGCDLPPEEVLARLQWGLRSDEELHPDFDAVWAFADKRYREEYRKQFDAETERMLHGDGKPEQFLPLTDRALILLALPSKGETGV